MTSGWSRWSAHSTANLRSVVRWVLVIAIVASGAEMVISAIRTVQLASLGRRAARMFMGAGGQLVAVRLVLVSAGAISCGLLMYSAALAPRHQTSMALLI